MIANTTTSFNFHLNILIATKMYFRHIRILGTYIFRLPSHWGCAIWRFLIMDDKNVSTICFRRNIVLQRTFWRLRTTPHTAVDGTLHLFAIAKVHYLHTSLVSFTRWSGVCFFWAHTPEARALKPCQTAPDYSTKLSFALIWSKHTRCTYRLSWLCLDESKRFREKQTHACILDAFSS